MMQTIDDVMQGAIAERIFPGAVVWAGTATQALFTAAYGTTMYTDPGSQPVTPNTIYDIASLTKMFTAMAALRLLDAGELTLHAPVAHYLPRFRASAVTVQHLITHTSGLDLRLSALRTRGAAGIWDAVYATMPTHAPGTYVAYTNINSLLLGAVVAQLYEHPLDKALHDLIIEPLGMTATTFRPAAALQPRIAPTEWDSEWRQCLVWGRVHDESAAALGGVAGHAGLFAPANDLAHFIQCWLQEGSFGGKALLRPATVALALRDYTEGLDSPTGSRQWRSGLGWMIDRPGFMGSAPPGRVGHTGFTGPVLLLVPQRRLGLIILSNRTYPKRTPPPYRHHAVTAAVVARMLAWSDV